MYFEISIVINFSNFDITKTFITLVQTKLENSLFSNLELLNGLILLGFWICPSSISNRSTGFRSWIHLHSQVKR
jgi:hypothetical protein